MKKTVYLMALLWVWVMASCSNRDYLNAIPAESSMLVSLNTAKMTGAGSQTLLKAFLHVTNMNSSGIDISKPVMLFEDAQGNLGVCAKTEDEKQLTTLLGKMGVEVQKSQGFHFAALPNHWMIGYSDVSALMMGPVLPASQSEMKQLMARYLKANEDAGIVGTPMYDKLDSIDAPMSMVCQAKALPEYLITPFTLGAPQGTDPSQVIIAANLEIKDGCLWVNGQTFSFVKRINEALQTAQTSYRPINGNYVASMSQQDAAGLFVNVDGTKFIKLMTGNRGIQAMLSGINTAIDMNSIIKGVDGDLAIITPSLGETSFQIMMAAKLKNADWLADVDYWKQSVPAGGTIGDWGRDSYYYRNGKTSYYFGVTPDWQYMSGGSEQAAQQSIKASANPIPKKVQEQLKGQKMAMVVNLSGMGDQTGITSFLKPLFGNVNMLVYTLDVK